MMAAALTMIAGVSLADSVVLRIRAINPSKAEKQSVEVKSFLPKPAGPDDVINAAGLDVAYDVAAKTYAVRKTVELNPGETRTFEVQLKDIWVIPEATLAEVEQHGAALTTALKGTAQGDTASRVGGVVAEGVKTVKERQNAYAVGAVKPIDHIRAYESNMEALDRIRRDIGMLENLAIAAGKDPGKILGRPSAQPPTDEVRSEGSTGQVVVIHIKVTNPSLTEKKKVPLRRDFPAEIKPTDVMDAGVLQVHFDSGRNMTYVFSEGVELGPQESKVFDVKVRNPWMGAAEKTGQLEARAKALLDLCERTEAYKSVAKDVESSLKDLDAIRSAKGPEAMSEDYVAFARRQAERLAAIEARVLRVEELFQPRAKPQNVFDAPVLNVRPPSSKTTWIIIYIILGFLGVVSLLFYLRWYGKSKAEKVEQGGGRVSGSGEQG